MLEHARSYFFLELSSITCRKLLRLQVRKAKTSREVFFDLILFFPSIPFAARLCWLEISAALSQ